jgi:hypothetical protein
LSFVSRVYFADGLRGAPLGRTLGEREKSVIYETYEDLLWLTLIADDV